MTTMTISRERIADSRHRAARVPQAQKRKAASPERVAVADTTALDVVDLWGMDSFPASDPPANW
jgi:ABC-type enterochelin transport system substrate-binding protein